MVWVNDYVDVAHGVGMENEKLSMENGLEGGDC